MNHSKEFVSETGAHTQGIEALWSRIKALMRERFAGRLPPRDKEGYDAYFAEMMFRDQYTREDLFLFLIRCIRYSYTPNVI